MSTHQLKAVDFEFTNELQEGRNADQYFVVCVNQVTEDDLQAYSDARENYGRSVSLVRLKLMSYYIYKKTEFVFLLYKLLEQKLYSINLQIANGPLVPRVIGCPGTMVFDAESSICVDA